MKLCICKAFEHILVVVTLVMVAGMHGGLGPGGVINRILSRELGSGCRKSSEQN